MSALKKTERRYRVDINLLVKKSKQGDGNAFWELIELKKHSLYRTAFWYVKNEDDAMDIVSEAVFKAYVSLHQLQNNDFFHTWLMRILIHCTFDFIKSRKDNSIQDYATIDKFHGQTDGSRDTLIDLHSAINTLDEKHRAVVILKYFEDMTLSQVGEVLSMPTGTVKTYLHRALLHLRVKMKEA
jgi:RNA polymerase sigma-70 factor, ECF subfamily